MDSTRASFGPAADARRPRRPGQAHRGVQPHIHRVEVGPNPAPLPAWLLSRPARRVEHASQRAGVAAAVPTVLNGIAFGSAQAAQTMTVRTLAGLVRCAFKLPPATVQRHFGWCGEIVRSAVCLATGTAALAGVARPWVPRECGALDIGPMLAAMGVAGAMSILPEVLMQGSGSPGLGIKLALNALTRPVMATLAELGRRANFLGVQAQLVVCADPELVVARIPADRLGQALDKPRLAIAALLCLTMVWMHGQLEREYETGLLAQAPADLDGPGALGSFLATEMQAELSAAYLEGVFEVAFAFAATWQALRNGLALRLVEDVRSPLAAADPDPANPLGPRIRARMVAGWLAGECSVMLAHLLGASGHVLTCAVQRAVYALCAMHGYVGQRATMAQLRSGAPQRSAGSCDIVAMLDGGAGWELRAAPGDS